MVKTLLLKYRNMRIRNKIMVIYIPLIILPLFLVVYTSNHIFTESIIQKTQKSIADESNLIVMRLEGMYSNTETCANLLSRDIDRAYEEYLKNNTQANTQDIMNFLLLGGKIESIIRYNIRSFKEIESVAFIDVNFNVVSTSRFINNEDNLEGSNLLKVLKEKGPPINIWFPMQTRNYLVTDSKTPVLTVGKKVVNADTGDIEGFLILNIKEETISSIFPDTADNNKGYFVIDRDGMVISTRNKQDLLKPINSEELKKWVLNGNTPTIEVQIENKKSLITSSLIKELDWRLINQTPLSDLTADIYVNSLIIIFIGIICIVAAFLSTFFLSRVIANPIIKLTKTAQEVKKGNLNIKSKIDTNDEVGILASVFNEMIEKVKELLDKVKSDQKKKREYELALIQSQIKPHFLYNTLDLIFVLCEMGNVSKASVTTKALADFYRVSLSKGREIISLRDELKIAQDYLSIQKVRYSDILDFSIEVSPDILNYSTLKMTIQPLVENSIYHGLKPKRSPGKILIKGYEEEDKIILKVVDDGVGIPEGKLMELFNSDSTDASKNSFGLKSVDERIKLYFGDEYGLKITSEPGKGTEITIIMPKNVGRVLDV